MTPHLAISITEIFTIAGMIVFFVFCLPRLAFAGATGTRIATPTRAAYHHILSPAESAALMRDRRNAHNPLYRVMDLLVKATGKRPYSYPGALFFISLIVRLALLPWTIRQFRNGQTLRSLEPQMRRLQEECKKDPAKLSAAIAALYKKHGIDTRFTLLSAIVQGAIFMSLYYMVSLYQYQFSHGSFLWIGSALAHSYPKWIAASLAGPDLPLLFLYGLSMAFTSWIAGNSRSKDNLLPQATIFAQAIIFSILIWVRHTPSAFVLYWLISNCLTLLTTAWISHWLNRANNPPKVFGK